ncbi:MAG TPA: S9 family peptidase [Candidatus Limnocylindrales bacterium]
MPARRPMRPEDIRRIVVVEELDLSVDGRTAIVVRRSISGDRYASHLYAIDLASDRAVPRPRRLTGGTTRDTKPRLCPDGHTIAFIRSDPRDDDAVGAAWILDVRRPDRAHPARLGKHGAVGEVAWSPDGRRLAFTAEVDPPRFIAGRTRPISQRGPAKGADGEAPLARRITRTDWRWDEEGHRDRWSHLFVIDMPSGRPRQITAGDWGVADIAWHPDGRAIAFSSDRGPEPDLHPRPTIWAVDVDDTEGEPREVLAPGGWATHPSWSPDGRWIAAEGVLEPEPLDDISPGVIIGPGDGRAGEPRLVAPDLDRPLGNAVDSDLTGWFVHGRHGPSWLDERRIVATISDRGRSRPWIFTLGAAGRGTDHRPAAAGELVTHTIATAPGMIAWLGTQGTRAMELMTVRADEGPGAAPVSRSTLGSRWQDGLEMPEMRLVEAPGPGGPIDVWVASPAGAPDAPLPSVVDVHGGPLGAWAPSPHIEVILLTSAGYRVILPNIRGSTSYGRDWIRPQLGDWGGVDADDVHAAIDHVVELGLADPDRLGVMGLSYGGFMTQWLVGTTDRFKAAVSENGVTNQVASWANSDGGPEYDRASLLGDPLSPEGIDKLWRQSPLRNVANVRTPLLMLQAEADHRCPASDNEQFFIALRHLGRTVEYVLYPDEYHVFAAAGRPDRRIDRNQRIIEWFDRYLR